MAKGMIKPAKNAVVGKINYKPKNPVEVKNFSKVISSAMKNHKSKAKFKEVKVGDKLRLDKMTNRVGTNFNK